VHRKLQGPTTFDAHSYLSENAVRNLRKQLGSRGKGSIHRSYGRSDSWVCRGSLTLSKFLRTKMAVTTQACSFGPSKKRKGTPAGSIGFTLSVLIKVTQYKQRRALEGCAETSSLRALDLSPPNHSATRAGRAYILEIIDEI